MSLFKLLRAARNPFSRRYFRDPYYPYSRWDQYDDLFYDDERINKLLDRFEEEFDQIYEAEFPQSGRGRRRPPQIDKASESTANRQVTSGEERRITPQTFSWGDYTADLESSTTKTFERANKIFEESTKSEHPNLVLTEHDDLLSGKESKFEELSKYFDTKEPGLDIAASNFESSTIFKDGKTVTVWKHSKLQPDGTIKTTVNQEYVDKNGKKDSRKWVKEDSIKKKAEKEKEIEGQEAKKVLQDEQKQQHESHAN